MFGGVYTVQLQAAGSRTRAGGEVTTAPLWEARFNRNGRTFGFRTSIRASDEEFRARSGFFPRPGLVHLQFQPRATVYGRAGSLMESATFDVNLNGRWRYDEFIGGDGILDEQLHFNLNTTLKGGWNLTGSLLLETFGYPFEIYRGYRVELPRAGGGADTVAFVGRPRIPNRDYVLSFETPEFKHFSGNAFILWGNDENFFEWSPGRIIISNFGMTWRPTGKLRLDGTYALQQVRRVSDGSLVNVAHLPRLKMEYQLSRPDLPAPGGRVRPREAGLAPGRYPDRGSPPGLRRRVRRLRPDPGVHPKLLPGRRALLLPAEPRHGGLPRLRQHAGRPGGSRHAAPGRGCAGSRTASSSR